MSNNITYYAGSAIFLGVGSWCLYNLIRPVVIDVCNASDPQVNSDAWNVSDPQVNSDAWNVNIKQRESKNISTRMNADVKRAMKVITKAQNEGARWADLKLPEWDRLCDEALSELRKQFRVTVDRSVEEKYRRAQIFEKLCEWTENEEYVTYSFEPKKK